MVLVTSQNRAELKVEDVEAIANFHAFLSPNGILEGDPHLKPEGFMNRTAYEAFSGGYRSRRG
jgi:hypothetical protein